MRRHPRPRGRSDQGFTLVELLLAMVVSMAVVGGATLLAGQMQSSYRAQLEAATAQQEGRYVIQAIERYLRAAGNNPYRVDTTPCPSSGTPVQAIRLDPDGDGQNDDIRVQMDANPTNGLLGGVSGACNEPNEDVTIFHDPATRTVNLRENNVGGGNTVLPLTDTIVTGLEFVYRNPLRAVTATAANVAFIETRVTVASRIDDLNLGAPVTYTVSSEIRVRSR
ncbi:MAG: prepilin-type N-terminal cleavage/methylation domain-containing protein [Acidobacteria bacterium]|nr:prepilin-type N-terminal cleavage/methylation domain-containing protein [Acidobacteriota bacterium]